jgi:hypothetical protein
VSSASATERGSVERDEGCLRWRWGGSSCGQWLGGLGCQGGSRGGGGGGGGSSEAIWRGRSSDGGPAIRRIVGI